MAMDQDEQNSENIIKLSQANIYQDKSLIIKNVSLEVKRGEFVYLIGKTGSGKSSLLKILYGDLPLREGEGSVVDIDLTKLIWKTLPKLRKRLGIVFQDFQLLMDRTVAENLEFVLKATGWKDNTKIKDRVNEVLTWVGLQTKDFKMPHSLSGGEQQRIVIARALLNNPELILADEPTGNLDPETSQEIMKLLSRVCSELNTAILMATHDYNLIKQFPGKIVKVDKGSLFVTQLNGSVEASEA